MSEDEHEVNPYQELPSSVSHAASLTVSEDEHEVNPYQELPSSVSHAASLTVSENEDDEDGVCQVMSDMRM